MADLTLEVENLQASFNPEQYAVFEAVLQSVRNNEERVFFL
jgi:hypothetical protein